MTDPNNNDKLEHITENAPVPTEPNTEPEAGVRIDPEKKDTQAQDKDNAGGNPLVDIFEEDESATRRISPTELAALREAFGGSEAADEPEDDFSDELDEFDIEDDDEVEERDFRPIRFARRGRLGLMGGVMYAVFIICLSVVLACAGWMAACDVLALYKDDVSVQIDIPEDIFSEKEIDIVDDEGNVTGTKTITVADIDEVARILKDNGIIEYPFLFKIFGALSNADQKVVAGAHELSTRYDYRAIVKNLGAATVIRQTTKITFPEGYTMAQIFEKLEEEGVCSVEALYDAAANYDFQFDFLEGSELGDAQRLEGYIFPNTYEFYIDEQPSSVISKFLTAFHYQIAADSDLTAKCENLGLSFREVITIASMIEKEAADDYERAKIASVIYNRLNSNMTLGIDATILYVHPEYDGGVDIPKEILEEDSPYNTHIYTGLTPTPICNPGAASIKAALDPESTWYLYYALDMETKHHQFFYSYNEFLAFVESQNYAQE